MKTPERGCRATDAEILADRQKEHREAKLMQPAADDANGRYQSDHAPAVKNARGNIGYKFTTNGGARIHSADVM